jgi:hypothetical protein
VGIQVLEVRFLPGSKATRAFVDLVIDGMTIRDFRVCQTNGKPSVQNPFTAYRDYAGKLCFRQIINLPSSVEVEAHALILSEYFRRLKEQRNGDRESE